MTEQEMIATMTSEEIIGDLLTAHDTAAVIEAFKAKFGTMREWSAIENTARGIDWMARIHELKLAYQYMQAHSSAPSDETFRRYVIERYKTFFQDDLDLAA